MLRSTGTDIARNAIVDYQTAINGQLKFAFNFIDSRRPGPMCFTPRRVDSAGVAGVILM